MLKLIALLLVVLSLVVFAAPAMAQTPGTAQDNACNAGGPLAGKCVQQWHYVCGWYLARFLNGPSGNGLNRWQAASPIPYTVSQPWFNWDCASLYEPYYSRHND